MVRVEVPEEPDQPAEPEEPSQTEELEPEELVEPCEHEETEQPQDPEHSQLVYVCSCNPGMESVLLGMDENVEVIPGRFSIQTEFFCPAFMALLITEKEEVSRVKENVMETRKFRRNF